MVARTPLQAAATAAAGEVTEGSGLGVSSAGYSGYFAGRGGQVWSSWWGFRRNDSVFMMDTPVDRN